MRTSQYTSLLLLACCSHETTKPPPRVEVTSHKSVEPSRDVSPLLAQLAYEASHRQTSSIKAEDALEALEATHVHILARRQFVGMSVHADYCIGGPTPEGVAVAVCEYPTHAAALAGKAYMDEHFAAMAPSARRLVGDATVLTLVDTPDRSHGVLVERAVATFSALGHNPQKEL